LICLLISDTETEKSGAALNVDVGSLEDPVDRQGLAHFCEHMLFMGTTKYFSHPNIDIPMNLNIKIISPKIQGKPMPSPQKPIPIITSL